MWAKVNCFTKAAFCCGEWEVEFDGISVAWWVASGPCYFSVLQYSNCPKHAVYMKTANEINFEPATAAATLIPFEPAIAVTVIHFDPATAAPVIHFGPATAATVIHFDPAIAAMVIHFDPAATY